MLKSIIRTAAALCALSSLFLAGPAAHAQAQPKPLLTARAEAAYVDVLIDNDQGTQYNAQMAKAYAAQFVGTQWQALDNGQLTITKDGKTLIAALALPSEDKGYFLLHARSAKMVVHGEMYRYRDEPSKGWATLFVDLTSNDGKSVANIRIGVPLAVVTETGGGTDNGGGFGGFGG